MPTLTDYDKLKVHWLLDEGVTKRKVATILGCDEKTVWRAALHRVDDPEAGVYLPTDNEIAEACDSIRASRGRCKRSRRRAVR